MNRKEFIRSCSVLCIGSLGLGMMMESCGTSNHFAQYELSGKQLVIKKQEFVLQKGTETTMRKYVLIKNDKMPFPICIFRVSDTEYHALYLECTHSGCEVQPQQNFLVCPCHGSEFTHTGKVLNPPAEKDLRTFVTTQDSNNIYIQLAS